MAAPYPPAPVAAAAATPSTRVELHISCDNLRDADLFSKSDPVVVVYTQTSNKQWVEVSCGSMWCRINSLLTDRLAVSYLALHCRGRAETPAEL